MVRAVVATAIAALASSPVAAPTTIEDLATAKKDAKAAGIAWLALVDDLRYAESWTQASSLFRQKLAQDEWVAMARDVRRGLGKLRERTFESANYSPTASGTLVSLVWTSTFASMPEVTEQINMILEDGTWRCLGYFVRPRSTK